MPIPWAVVANYAARGWTAYQAALAVRDEFCQFAADYPGFVDAMIGAIPDGGLLNGLVPAICPSLPPPSPAPAPYTGGQCCTEYWLTWISFNDTTEVEVSERAFGRLGAITDERSIDEDGLWNGSIFLSVDNGCGGQPKKIALAGATRNPQEPRYRDLRVERVDGLPDNCGDLSPRPPLSIPPPDRLNFDITLDVGGVNVNIPVSFNFSAPTIGGTFAPTLNINVGGGDFVFSPDGVDIYIGGSWRPGDDAENPPPGVPRDPRDPADRPPLFLPRPRPDGDSGDRVPPPPPPPPPPGGECPDVNLQPILTALEPIAEGVEEALDILNELKDCDRCDRPSPEECQKQFIGSGQGAKFALPDNCEWVGIEIIEKPTNYKGYFNEGSPDVLFCGWHSFGSADCEGERVAIQYEKNVFPRQEGASWVSFGLQSKHRASYFIYLKQEEGTD